MTDAELTALVAQAARNRQWALMEALLDTLRIRALYTLAAREQ